MGIFTWTDARRMPRRPKNGYDWISADKIGYGGYAKIVCPDGTEYATDYYYGDGMFGCVDAYEVIVDINKEDLPRIIKKYGYKRPFLCECAKLLSEGKSEREITDFAYNKIKKEHGNEEGYDWLYEEWKRNIGIMMCCDDKDNDNLKYPLKITSIKKKVSYDDLYPSYNTQ